MEKFNQACRLMETKDITSLRKAIELFEASDADGKDELIAQCKREIHELYEAKKRKKLYKKITALGCVALVIIILIIIYSSFMGKIRARELVIHENFEGLEFYGELHTTEQDDDGIVWQVDEETTFLFKDGNIMHGYVRNLVPLNVPEDNENEALVPQRAELDIPIYTYEVFINTKGDVFLHIEHSLFPVLVDENDVPYEIQKYNGKTLKLIEKS